MQAPVARDRSQSLSTAFEEGRHAWPLVALKRDAFETYVAARSGGEADPPSLEAGDIYLACACAQGDERALAEFDRHYLSQVPSFLAGTRASRHFADEVRQQVRERLFVDGRIAQYSGRGTLGSWLRVVTVRVATDLRRQERQERPVRALDDALVAGGLDPELGIIKLRYGESFRAALRTALLRLDAEDRSVLRLHYLDELNIERIAAVLRVSRATVGRRIVALRRRILRAAREVLRAELKVTAAELESLLRVVRSDLAVSLSQILQEP
jgi:RNA polymerase sigma-70 factor (ECF subfamily)